MLIVIAAMEQELSGLRGALKSCRSEPAEMHVIGIGKEQARANVAKILDSRAWQEGDGLLMMGFAGGLDPVLKCGDLLLPTFYYAESGDSMTADTEMWKHSRVAAVEAELPVVQGNSLTVSQIIATPQDKSALYQEHQVGSVNMEDYWVAEAATEARVPFLSARAVLDPACQCLPHYVLGLAGQPAKAAGRVIARPWRVPTMVRLARMRMAAQASLTRFGMVYLKHEMALKERQPTAS